MARVLVLSFYELGNQPIEAGRALAAARAAGHEATVVDLAVQEPPHPTTLAAIERVVCTVPMHTALRLASETVARWRAEGFHRPTCYLGLYAPTARALGLDLGDAAIVAPGRAFLAWLADPHVAPAPIRRATRDEVTPVVDRRGLPGLESYARLQLGGDERLVAAIEASQGCNHRCRHCPVPIVYEGRSRALELAEVLAEIDECVALGAEHVSFADPDFLNRPAHARRVAAALHAAHPDVTFDATIKVSHLRRHEALLAELRACGLVFVVSAFESTSPLVLERLDKGHVAADLGEVVVAARALGIEIRPSLLPFTPWSTREDLVELFDFVRAYDLEDNVDPVQLTIRLLLPAGSLLLERDDPILERALLEYDPASLGWKWRHADPLLDELALEFAAIVERATAAEEDPAQTHRALRRALEAALRCTLVEPEPRSVGPERSQRARRTESWFCCAEPTSAQRRLPGSAQARTPTCAPVAP